MHSSIPLLPMKKILLTLSALTLLSACTTSTGGNSNSSPSSSTASSASTGSSVQTYTNTDDGYAIDYPSFLTVTQNDRIISDDVQADGTAFTFPASFSDGNTLTTAKIAIATLPECPASQMTSSVMEQYNGISFQKKDWNEAGAGNLYAGTNYSTTYNDKCYMVTMFTRSCNLGPDCAPGHTTPFTEEPLYDVLHSMLATIRFL